MVNDDRIDMLRDLIRQGAASLDVEGMFNAKPSNVLCMLGCILGNCNDHMDVPSVRAEVRLLGT